MVRVWFVVHGPDSRHLQEWKKFDRLKDAKSFYAATQSKAKQLFSLDFEPFHCGANRRVICEVVA